MSTRVGSNEPSAEREILHRTSFLVCNAPRDRSISEEADEHVERSFRLAMDKGIKMALGSDLDGVGLGDNAKELYSMVRRGLPIVEALRVATLNGADLIGVDDRGEIAEGLLADLIAVRGSPLEDVRVMEDVRWVMQRGRVVKDD